MTPPDGSPARAGAGRALERGEKRLLALLALPALTLALAITVVTTYLPVVAKDFVSSDTLIGLLIAVEGMLALVLPLAAGTWSDQLRSQLGGRLPFLLAGTPVMALALTALAFVASIGTAVVLVALFFGAYFVVYEPYRALYPDLFPDEVAGRAQSTQGVARGLGTLLALVGGGLLLSIGQAVPFLVGAAILAVGIGLFSWALARRRASLADEDRERPEARGVRTAARDLWGMVRDRGELRLFVCANALWELSLGAVKTFVVLFLTVGVGLSLGTSSAVIAGAAVFILLGAATAGTLGDRYGKVRVMRMTLIAYGIGLVVPLVTQEPLLALPAVPLVAFGGGVAMTLPYAILMPRMPQAEHGTLTGFFSLSRGLGTMLGPLLAGAAVDLTQPVLEGTDGYAAIWGVAAVAILASIPLLDRLGEPGERGTAS